MRQVVLAVALVWAPLAAANDMIVPKPRTPEQIAKDDAREDPQRVTIPPPIEQLPPPPPPPPPNLYGEDVPTGEGLVYVIDQSGSMRLRVGAYEDLDGDTVHHGNRLDRAKVEFARSVSALDASYRFNVYAFDCSTSRWKKKAQRATDRNKAAAISWVNGLRPMGATGTAPAVVKAFKDDRIDTVALLSDGGPNCGMFMSQHRDMIRNKNARRVIVHTFGIRVSGPPEAFMRGVAQDNGGNYVSVR